MRLYTGFVMDGHIYLSLWKSPEKVSLVIMLLHPLKVQLQQLFTLGLTWRTTVMSVSRMQPSALTTGLFFNAGENKCLPLNMCRCQGHSQVETKNGHKISLFYNIQG